MSAALVGDITIGSDATPYARRAVEIALSQLGVYGGDPAVYTYTGGINTNWCKAFVVWAYSQTGESRFESPREAFAHGHRTEQHVMGEYAKAFPGHAYRAGNAGEPEKQSSDPVHEVPHDRPSVTPIGAACCG